MPWPPQSRMSRCLPSQNSRRTAQTWLEGCEVHTMPTLNTPSMILRLDGAPVTALLELGSTISLAWHAVVPPEQCPFGKLLVSCVHRDICKVPVMEVCLGLSECVWTLTLGVIDDLPVPLDEIGLDYYRHSSWVVGAPEWRSRPGAGDDSWPPQSYPPRRRAKQQQELTLGQRRESAQPTKGSSSRSLSSTCLAPESRSWGIHSGSQCWRWAT